MKSVSHLSGLLHFNAESLFSGFVDLCFRDFTSKIAADPRSVSVCKSCKCCMVFRALPEMEYSPFRRPVRFPGFVVNEQALKQADCCSSNDLLVRDGVIFEKFGLHRSKADMAT